MANYYDDDEFTQARNKRVMNPCDECDREVSGRPIQFTDEDGFVLYVCHYCSGVLSNALTRAA